jgi:hypothetical protein
VPALRAVFAVRVRLGSRCPRRLISDGMSLRYQGTWQDRRPNLGQIAKIPDLLCAEAVRVRSAGSEAATAMRHSGSWGDFVKNYWKRLRAICRGPRSSSADTDIAWGLNGLSGKRVLPGLRGLGGDLCSSNDRLNSRADGPLTAHYLRPRRHAGHVRETRNGVAVDLGQRQPSPFAAPLCQSILIVVIITLSMMRKPLKVVGIDMPSSKTIELCSGGKRGALHHNRLLRIQSASCASSILATPAISRLTTRLGAR